jgi:hypothetical protein
MGRVSELTVWHIKQEGLLKAEFDISKTQCQNKTQRDKYGVIKMKDKVLLFLCASLLFLSSQAHAATTAMPVEIISTGDDAVGQRLIYAVKEKIRSSSSLQLTFNQTKPRIQVYIGTMDLTGNGLESSVATSFSIAIAFKDSNRPLPLLLDNFPGYCGTSRVNEEADSIVAAISEQVDYILKMSQDTQ